ncbi:MAG: coproporphyrinogen III oxidase family protein [Actinomycetota bacterium]|jgi:coproporphyrinogen III oxidase-like Fe-S oxidoreductase|nr:coproporphyrinogen III oxidase family protein [Actinomycetota bacterium]
MFAERMLTSVMRHENSRNLRLRPFDKPGLPGPKPGVDYMLYVHIPFCESLCPYCSFNRFPFSPERAVPYFEQLRTEMRMVAEQGYDFGSMYIGGGTPTVMIDELCKTIDLARELFSIREVSSETNPNHLIPEIVDPLVDRVQRFSVGVQSFDDGLLKEMDRYHKYGSGAEILERLQSIEGRFHSLNVDMIFNFPSQTREMLLHDAEMLKASLGNQTTFYPLMASRVVQRQLSATVGKVDYAREARFYGTLVSELSDTYEPASAWTFSRIAGGMIDEYIVDYEEYVGIGSGAFSYLDGAIYVNTFSLREYGKALDDRRSPVSAWRPFAKREQMRYRFMMGLFGLGLDKLKFKRDFGVSVEQGLRTESMFMRLAGAYDVDDIQHITLTAKGRYLLVAMMREFFIGVNAVRDQARAVLPPEERELLFGAGCAMDEGHAAEETEAAVDGMPKP